MKMAISEKLREKVRQKYNGLCAYSGTPLEDDWQVDHVKPKYLFEIGLEEGNPDDIDNLMPVQKLINHYKRALDLENFRNERLGRMHLQIAELPKNPRTEKSKKRKKYLLKIADYFGITEKKPFNKIFYFETLMDAAEKKIFTE